MLALSERSSDLLREHALASAFLPETLTGMKLLDQLRAQTGRVVFVVDEYGVVQGIMTPPDLLEVITAERRSVQDAKAWATRRESGSWLIRCLLPN
ncbi:hypothetical protein [Comamonas testosteroni]|uniref:hypothetical protein n=1 Tax=Comamonas testosteroni TaxID=285 RepID=UPI000A8A3B11|nr:hypothetical protein [Comamonas testosteroni]